MRVMFQEQVKCGTCGAGTNAQILFFNDGLCDNCWTKYWQWKHLKMQEGNKPQGMMAEK